MSTDKRRPAMTGAHIRFVRNLNSSGRQVFHNNGPRTDPQNRAHYTRAPGRLTCYPSLLFDQNIISSLRQVCQDTDPLRRLPRKYSPKLSPSRAWKAGQPSAGGEGKSQKVTLPSDLRLEILVSYRAMAEDRSPRQSRIAFPIELSRNLKHSEHCLLMASLFHLLIVMHQNTFLT